MLRLVLLQSLPKPSNGDQRELITNKGNNKWKKWNLQDVSQLYTKQVGTGVMIK